MASLVMPDGSTAPPPLRGFEHVNRYYDPHRDAMTAKILPGEFYVTKQDEYIMTVLGSCVSACIWDPDRRVGGMNHFMLPETNDQTRLISFATASEAARYGTFAMEHLINEVMKHGARRASLLIKIVGGGRVLAGATDVGARNINFVRDFIRNENLRLVGEHVGGFLPRKVSFHPLTGRAQVKELRSMANPTIVDRERAYQTQLRSDAKGGDVELF